jgi:hypothetical protein
VPPASPGPYSRSRPIRRVSRQALLAGILIALGLNLAALLRGLRNPRTLDGGDVLLALVTLASGLALLIFVEAGRRRRSSRRVRQ